jgi:electron transport complex protein RnfG
MEKEVKKTAFKDTMAGPTVVLLIICLVVSAALAFTYQLTAPQIEKINKENADAARLAVLPDADSFTAVEGDLPEGVAEYYVADNGSGVVVTAQNKSFGGTITVMVGFDTEGAITGVKITDHSDTPGLGTKAQDAAYLEKQYTGKTSTDNAGNIKKDSQIEAVTGATVSSNGIYGAVNYAIAAFGEMGGLQ